MSLEDSIGVFWLHNIKISCQGFEVLAELLVRDNGLKVAILALIGISLTSNHEG